MSCCSWKCIPIAISGGVDLSEVPGCHLLWEMSSQSVSHKLLQGLVSHELRAYLCVLNPFLNNELWSYYQKDVTHIILNHITL